MGQQYGIISGGGGVGDVEISVSQVVGGTSGEVLVVGGAGELEQVAIDTTPTNGSTNLIDSNAVFDGLATKVPDSRTITINGTTQDLTANRTWTIPTGITVGTTAISSGTVGRVLFEGAGNVIQEDAALFWDNTNKRLGIGATPDTSVRLDIRSQGALSTDIAFRVRNSANTFNTLQITGDSKFVFQVAGNSATTNNSFHVMGDNESTIIEVGGWDTSGSRKRGFLARSSNNGIYTALTIDYGNSSGAGTSSGHLEYFGSAKMNFANYNGNGWAFMRSTAATLTNQNTVFAIYNTNIQGGGGTIALGTTLGTTITSLPATTYGKNTFFIANGTAPTTTGVDAFAMYSADIVSGNAAPHFRTENGDIVKLYSVGGWGLPTGTLTRTTFDSGTVTLAELAERVAALITDLRDSHGLLKA